MTFCPALGMVGKVFAWPLPVDQFVASDVALVLLVFPCPPHMLFCAKSCRMSEYLMKLEANSSKNDGVCHGMVSSHQQPLFERSSL